jgi:glycosyltransferase involved in cell wall biosynthesis
LRILAVNWQDLTNPLAGGAEVHLEEILKRVVGWGHEVTLACSSYPGAVEREVIDGIEVRRKGGRHTFNYRSPILIKHLLEEKPYDLIVEDINKIPSFLPIFFNYPFLAVIPHLFGKTIYQEVNPILASYVYLSEQPIPRVYSRARFLAISQSTREDLITRGIQAEKIDVSECGIDHHNYTPGNNPKRFEPPTILYLGRMKRYKAVDHIISALPRVRRSVPNARVVLVGDGDFLPDLKSLAKKLGLEDAVEFPGFVGSETKLEFLRRSHVSIYPSPKEGWGITNIEANACRTPVVAANSPGLRDSVNPEHSGLLYEFGNIDQLADAIVRVLTDQSLFEHLCKGAVEWARQFTWESCARGSFESMQRAVDDWRGNG